MVLQTDTLFYIQIYCKNKILINSTIQYTIQTNKFFWVAESIRRNNEQKNKGH